MCRRALKYKMYDNKRRNGFLHDQIEFFADPYNHLLALRRRYYRMYGRSISKDALKAHLTKLKETERFGWWSRLPSQALQDVLERIEFGYEMFFAGHNKRPPQFRRCDRYRSFTLKQCGYKFLDGNRIVLSFGIYGCVRREFRYHGPKDGEREFDVESVKTVTIKRDRVGDIWLCITVECDVKLEVVFKTGETVGFDFGLKQYLTVSDGTVHVSPEFFKRGIREVKQAYRNLSRKVRGSGNRERARLHLSRVCRRIANRRENYHWHLANQLVKRYDVLCFETLNLEGMKKLWGRKVSDLGFADFLIKLQWVARKHGKSVVFIDKWYPSSKTCNACGTVKEDLDLRDRVFSCDCGWSCDRDLNVAYNIHEVGKTTFAGGVVRQG